jgi:hypothetical protein
MPCAWVFLCAGKGEGAARKIAIKEGGETRHRTPMPSVINAGVVWAICRTVGDMALLNILNKIIYNVFFSHFISNICILWYTGDNHLI